MKLQWSTIEVSCLSKLRWNFTWNFIETLAKFRISFNWSFIESFNWNLAFSHFRPNLTSKTTFFDEMVSMKRLKTTWFQWNCRVVSKKLPKIGMVLYRNLLYFFLCAVSRETSWNWRHFFCYFGSKMKLAVVSWF